MSSKEILSIFLHVIFYSRRQKNAKQNDLNKGRRKKKQIFIFKSHSVSWLMFHKLLYRHTKSRKIRKYFTTNLSSDGEWEGKYLDNKLGQGLTSANESLNALALKYNTLSIQSPENVLRRAKRKTIKCRWQSLFRFIAKNTEPSLAVFLNRWPQWVTGTCKTHRKFNSIHHFSLFGCSFPTFDKQNLIFMIRGNVWLLFLLPSRLA